MSDYIKFVDVGDNHGDEENQEVTAKLFAFLDDFKPHTVIHGGDCWNFSHLREGASAKDEDRDATPDWAMGSEFFLRYMSYGKRRIFLRGNHDERLWDTHKRATKEAVRKYALSGIHDVEKLVAKRRVEMLSYNSRTGVVDLGGLRLIHGYAHGASAPRKFAATYGTCLFHHLHSMDVGVFEKYPEPSVAYGSGCLMHVDQDYNARQMNKLRHENGFLYGFIKNGNPTVYQARVRKDGSMLLAHEFRSY